ncbi:MAG: hypothetical protein ACI8S6_004786 [Myxococcota bacterium]|jgi:hypothetical protein
MLTRQQAVEPLATEQDSSSLSSLAMPVQQPRGNAAAIEAMSSSSAPVEVQSAGAGASSLLLKLSGLSTPFATLLGGDGKTETLSGEDLIRGQKALVAALPDLKEHADTPAQASEAIWLLYELTTLPADVTRQRALDLGSGAIVELPMPEKFSRGTLGTMLSVTRRNLTAAETIQDNKGPGGSDPVSRTEKDDFESTVGAAMAARDQLKRTFGFDPSDRSFAAIEILVGRIPDARIGEFVDAYLTAFFVHGGNLTYDHDVIESQPTSAFFGSPPGCDQLPDGRGIIDCQGFGAVGRLILAALKGSTNERGGEDLCLPFAIKNHQVVLMLAGTSGCVVDNDQVHPLPLSTAEREHLHALHESRFSYFWGETKSELTGPIDLSVLPSLQTVINTISARFGWVGPKVSWMEALNVD